MTDIKITVLIPVYNMKSVISRAIESVLLQSYHNIELVVLDGGSEDGTLDVLKKYKDDIDVFVSQKDKGPSFAMASNLEKITGDYVTMLGADDWYCDENAIAEAVVTIENTGTDVAFGDCNFVYSEGNVIRKKVQLRGLDNLYYYNSLFTISSFVRSDLLSWYYGEYWSKYCDRVNISTDHFLWLLLYHNGYKFAYINSDNAITNFSTMGRSNTNIYKGCIEGELILREVLRNDNELLDIYLEKYGKYFAARTLALYIKVLGPSRFASCVKTHIQNKKYAIFGVGDMGRTLFEVLSVCGMTPVYLIDNNPDLDSTQYMGVEVISPEKLKNKIDLTVVIAAFGNELAIREQLSNLSMDSSMEIVDYVDIALDIQKILGTDILNMAFGDGTID